MNKKATPTKRQKSTPYSNKGRAWLYCVTTFIVMLVSLSSWAQSVDLKTVFSDPSEAARPWVFWYWMNACVSKAGITADLEAMKEAGIGGAYLMPIRGAADPSPFEPTVEQLTPEWWAMVRHAMHEADRLCLKLGMHVCDGFALAGGPWITPEHSMQKVVWTEKYVQGPQHFSDHLAQPKILEGFYRDIAVLAFPSPEGTGISTRTVVPKVTSSLQDGDLQRLVIPDNTQRFRSDEPCWIQYAFDEPFTCRSLQIRRDGNNFQANRLRIEISDDGMNFHPVCQLEPPRHGWQDTDVEVTHTIEPTTARFFRFVYDTAGSEPGAEDLDSAKWRPSLRIHGIELFSLARIHQYEGKNGDIWRIGRRTTSRQVPDTLCVPRDRIIDISDCLKEDGRLEWDVPEGRWTILRVGHTSSGHRNVTGGGASGLECDKFSPEAARIQFDHWFGEVFRKVGPDLASRILKNFHIDSWECSSQNWSATFRKEFERRRGYDLMIYLPAMAGIPVQSADVSERFLNDIRQTIAELVVDIFYDTMAELAHEKGCRFSAECVAPTMMCDGMLHYSKVDLAMGEFWLRSPTHDKPNDMLDAISGGHIYGKQIIQAEAFTQLRMAWDEHPGMLKAIGDRNYALGINRFVYHVYAHNPWLDRRPGMTLNDIGLFFQRDQTWWRPGRTWVTYARRCQAMLQWGRPVVDIAVFTGENTPRRAILPDRLVSTLPGLFGPDCVEQESERLANRGEPQRQLPRGVTHSANMADPEDWIDPLRGYAYDSVNRDALLRLGEIKDGSLVLPGGAEYRILVVPGSRPMARSADLMTPECASRLRTLVEAGATLLLAERPARSPSLTGYPECDRTVSDAVAVLWPDPGDTTQPENSDISIRRIGLGRVITGPYTGESLDILGIERDVIAQDSSGRYAKDIAWTHRAAEDTDLYFISNQQDQNRDVTISLRITGRIPEIWNPVTGDMREARTWRFEDKRTILPLHLAPNESLFMVLCKPTSRQAGNGGSNALQTRIVQTLEGLWTISFDPNLGGPEDPVVFDTLQDWSSRSEPGIRYYSGTASYSKDFAWQLPQNPTPVWLDLGNVANLAEVFVNDQSCGVAWTAPYRVEITKALHPGNNQLRIEVTNTWANRLIGDHALQESEQVTWTTASYRLGGTSLLKAGLLGPVALTVEADE